MHMFTLTLPCMVYNLQGVMLQSYKMSKKQCLLYLCIFKVGHMINFCEIQPQFQFTEERVNYPSNCHAPGNGFWVI